MHAVIIASTVLQMLAAIAALRLVRVTGMRLGWLCIAIGLSLMAWRRIIVFSDLTTGKVLAEQIAFPEVLALILSAFLFAGVATIGPYFRSLEENTKLRMESERKYRAVADMTYDWEYWLDERLRFVYISPSCERFCGYGRDELAADPGLLERVFDPPSYAAYQRSLQEVLEKKRAVDEVLKMKSAGGGLVIVRHIATPAVVDGHFCGIRGSFSDITEAQLARQEVEALNKDLEQRVQRRTRLLQEANNDLEAFVYSVSHDLKAPLRHLDGFAKALLDDYGDKLDQEGKDMLVRISHASMEMNALIDGLLRLSRIASKELEKTWVDVSATAREVFDEYRYRLAGDIPEVEVEDGIRVFGDEVLIHSVLQNLIDNSVKYRDKSRPCRIAVRALKEAGMSGFVLEDNGRGFPAKDAGKLFKVFSRLHMDADVPGTGVGLASVYRVVLRHEGKVWAESVEGEYSRFFVLLPDPLPLADEAEGAVANSG